MQVMNAVSGMVAEVIAEHERWYWLLAKDGDQPFVAAREGWPALSPRAGDIWKTYDGVKYRVLGVDERLGQYFLIPLHDFYAGGWPVVFARYGEMQIDIPDGAVVYVRRLPEEGLKLDSRPK
jgi:hypothetical protein